MIENKEVMARNIKKYMERNRITAAEICKELDIKQNTFSDWVNAKTYPRIDKIELLARKFGISKSLLVEDNLNLHRHMIFTAFVGIFVAKSENKL